MVTGNKFLPRVSNENALLITSAGNVSVSRWIITLVTIPLLDLVMIHWIQRIQWNSFKENSIVSRARVCYGLFIVLISTSWDSTFLVTLLDRVTKYVNNSEQISITISGFKGGFHNGFISIEFFSDDSFGLHCNVKVESVVTGDCPQFNIHSQLALLDQPNSGRCRDRVVYLKSIGS